ncbi:hypothetical protein M9458_058174 [Cirrhinus mrigala]|uniref:Uncharacterized protein n=1 Tax=Cirrhinus mrigala TaxID=683832 RepID=A0ABD0MA76_CIRMR
MLILLDPVNPSAHHLLDDPSTPPPASTSILQPSSSIIASSSLISLAPAWTVTPLPPPQDCTAPAARCPFIPLASLGSSFPPAPPQSFVTLAQPRPSGFPPTPSLLKPSAPPWPCKSSASPWLVSSLSPPLPALPPLPFLHHGSSLHWLPSWLRLGSISFMVSPSIITTLDSVYHPPTGPHTPVLIVVFMPFIYRTVLRQETQQEREGGPDQKRSASWDSNTGRPKAAHCPRGYLRRPGGLI